MSKTNPHISEEAHRLHAIFQYSQDGIVIINQTGTIENINPAGAKLFGYQSEEVIGQELSLLIPDTEIESLIKKSQDATANDSTSENRITELQGQCKDGSSFPFLLSINEVQLKEKKIYTGFIHDITNIKKKELLLEESRNRLSAIFETAVDGIIIIDRRGLIRTINPAVTKLFGYTQEELKGKNISVLMPEPHRSKHDEYIHNYQTTGHAKIIGIGREVEGKRKDGTTFPFNLGVSEVRTSDEVIYTGIIHDLTAYKKKEQEIRDLNQTLEERVRRRTNELSETVNKLLNTNKKLNHEIAERQKVEEALRASEIEILHSLRKEKELGELKSRFVSMASHEFRTPLSTILSSVSLISRYKEAGKIENIDKHIDRIKSSVGNLTNILNDFLSISKLEEGKIENNPQPFDLYAFCTAIIEELEGMLKDEQKINLTGLDQNITVTLDRKLLKNILLNLLSNGIKYSPSGSSVNLHMTLQEEQLSIQVCDQGIGIPPADQQYLFSRFFRATNVTNIQGTGLGLNIVRKYVELMGGSITFESKENEGTTFTVLLPVKAR